MSFSYICITMLCCYFLLPPSFSPLPAFCWPSSSPPMDLASALMWYIFHLPFLLPIFPLPALDLFLPSYGLLPPFMLVIKFLDSISWNGKTHSKCGWYSSRDGVLDWIKGKPLLWIPTFISLTFLTVSLTTFLMFLPPWFPHHECHKFWVKMSLFSLICSLSGLWSQQ